MANCTKKVTAINCKGNSSCEWIDGKCQYKEGEEKNGAARAPALTVNGEKRQRAIQDKKTPVSRSR